MDKRILILIEEIKNKIKKEMNFLKNCRLTFDENKIYYDNKKEEFNFTFDDLGETSVYFLLIKVLPAKENLKFLISENFYSFPGNKIEGKIVNGGELIGTFFEMLQLFAIKHNEFRDKRLKEEGF